MRLVLVQPGKEFYMQTDASRKEVGCILEHMNDQGQRRPIAFYGRKLNKARQIGLSTILKCMQY